ncbi:SRR1-like protein [Bactrocera neohumeralis]|uniref:SRR1-like protein n=1 Tax=Bactrocera tryoni TaxID=59916 RepID=UPI001A962DE7|nr:SRR1-like protein [Bactrocera tryoni]XP_039970338.1 SRR1-like protein [Bactrocera tryoni]XP_050324101.1 SRR1-like protein [Bactrocera neohumeralis]
MSEEFRAVTRKKWIARRSINPRLRRLSERCNEKEEKEVDVEAFLKRLEQLCTQMLGSDYFIQAMETVDESLKALIDNEKFSRLVCFGIGPFSRNFQALHQLAFIICTQRHYSIDEAIYFDPVFRESEKQILQRLNCALMSENCEAKYSVDERTLFYLPHCPNCLTNNLLWSNWRPKCLKHLVLINNSFESLSLSKTERLLRLDSSYILDVLPYVKEYQLEDDYETHNVFNDLSVHVFPMASLPASENPFWAEREAPTYTDVEMISAEEFGKLSLT